MIKNTVNFIAFAYVYILGLGCYIPLPYPLGPGRSPVARGRSDLPNGPGPWAEISSGSIVSLFRHR